jgi:hypothetical protein
VCVILSLRMLKSVVKPQDFMLSLDVESTYFHVPIHLKHHKFFSSHLALPLFVNNKFIERVLSRGLAVRLDQLAKNLNKCHVSSRRSPSPPRYAHTALCRRPLDRRQLLRGSFSDSPNHRGDASRRGDRPRATQWLLRHTFADPTRSSGIQHLHHWYRSPTGSREEVLCAPPSNASAAFRDFQQSATGRLRPPSVLRRRSHLVLASSSVSSISPPRGVQLPRVVQAALLPLTRGSRQPSLLTQLLKQEPREPSRVLTRPAIYGDLHRHIGHHGLGLSAGAASRGNEIECRLVGFVRSVGDDISNGAQGCSPRPPSESRRHTWSHGQTLPRQHGSCRCPSQDVFKVPSFNDRDQGTPPLTSRTQDPTRSGLHSERSKFGG